METRPEYTKDGVDLRIELLANMAVRWARRGDISMFEAVEVVDEVRAGLQSEEH